MKCVCRYQWVAAVLAGLAFSCAPASPGKEQTKALTTQASPSTQPTPAQFAEVDRAIERLRPHLRPWYAREFYRSAKALVKELPDSFMDSLVAVLRSPGKYEAPDDKEILENLAGMAIVVLTDRRQRDRLVDILSVRCPPNIGFAEVEYILVVGWPEIDSILILRDAYLRSTDPANKAEIADAFRRAFGANGIKDANDEKLIQKCLDWYNRHRGAMDIVYDYGHSRDCDVVPLFVPAGTKIDPGAGWGFPVRNLSESPSTRRASIQPRPSPSTRPSSASQPAGTE